MHQLMMLLERSVAGKDTDLLAPLERIAQLVKKRGSRCDYLGSAGHPSTSCRRTFGYLCSRGHEVMIIRVLDPVERDFTFDGAATFRDLESQRDMYVDPAVEKEEYDRRFREHESQIEQICGALGVNLSTMSTDESLDKALFHLLSMHASQGVLAHRSGSLRQAERYAMSFLAPLYVAGALAIGLPILFHLIQRRPRGEKTFSSLMFLSASPPRLTRRSRLDNLLLLLLRAAALILIASAFARPFLRSYLQTIVQRPERRVGDSVGHQAPACSGRVAGPKRKRKSITFCQNLETLTKLRCSRLMRL